MVDLKKVRENAGFTQQELADKVGVVRQTISNIECGISLPSVINAQAIAQILNFEWVSFYD